jgi:DNA-binding MurR/RpiR family transcriptional regulator
MLQVLKDWFLVIRAERETVGRVASVAQPSKIRQRLQSVGLTEAEARVSAVIIDDLEAVAFGTMADLAAAAGTGPGTVARLCSKLGLSGFAELQRVVRPELLGALGPASERIKDKPAGDVLGRVAEADALNVASTFAATDSSRVQAASKVLSDLRRHVVVVCSDACAGIGQQYGGELASLRPNVEVLHGNPVAVARRLALGDKLDVVVAVDIRRYDAWLVDAAKRFAKAGATVIALSDSAASPLGRIATHHFTIAVASPGPFDSFTGALALLNALNAETAVRLRRTATDRLAKVEQAWNETAALDR